MGREPVDLILGRAEQQLVAQTTRLEAVERRSSVMSLRAAFSAHMESFLDRRREFLTDISDQRRDEIRAEYREAHRLVRRAYRPVRDLLVEFLGEEPRYDLRRDIFEDGGYEFPVDYPFTQWWDSLTFDEALDRWANADDDHIRRHLQREEAVLDAFEDWAGTERPSPEPAPSAVIPPLEAPPPRSGRVGSVLNHPWMVTVGGGIAVVAILALVKVL